jgi:hypothetical protein
MMTVMSYEPSGSKPKFLHSQNAMLYRRKALVPWSRLVDYLRTSSLRLVWILCDFGCGVHVIGPLPFCTKYNTREQAPQFSVLYVQFIICTEIVSDTRGNFCYAFIVFMSLMEKVYTILENICWLSTKIAPKEKCLINHFCSVNELSL